MVRFFNVILKIQRSIMKVSEINVDKVFMLTSEDSVAKALNIMYENNINQIPIIDDDGKYIGMIYAKQFLGVNATPSSKLKSFLVNTPILSSEDNIEKCAQLIVATGNRALPIVENGKLSNIVSETDVVLTSDFGHARVDEVMSGAIVIEEDDTLSNALPKITDPTIHIAHLDSDEARKEIEDQMTRFLKKSQGKLENIRLVTVYVDKHKTHKYSLRARIITTKGVVAAKAVGYDPLSACKELISRLNRRIRSEHSQKIKDRQHRESTRKVS